jgi:hypothetical protein
VNKDGDNLGDYLASDPETPDESISELEESDTQPQPPSDVEDFHSSELEVRRNSDLHDQPQPIPRVKLWKEHSHRRWEDFDLKVPNAL